MLELMKKVNQQKWMQTYLFFYIVKKISLKDISLKLITLRHTVGWNFLKIYFNYQS